MSKTTISKNATIESLTHDDAQITEHLGATGKDAKSLNLQTQLLKNRYVLRQIALKTYGTVVAGRPEFIGYFKNPSNGYAGTNKWMLRLTTGINQSAFAASSGDTLPNSAVGGLHDYLLEVAGESLSEEFFLADLGKAILKILPEAIKKAAKPSNAMANAIGLICADIGKVTPDQRAALLQALGTVAATIKPAIRKVAKNAEILKVAKNAEIRKVAKNAEIRKVTKGVAVPA